MAKQEGMETLSPVIEALLCKVQADAAATCRDYQAAISLYKMAMEVDSSVIDPEQLARLTFVTKDWEALGKIVPSIREGRRAIWQALLDVRGGGEVVWPEASYEASFDAAYRGYFHNAQGRFEEAKALWMDYLKTVETSWEHDFLSEIWLEREPTQCRGCREKAAIACVGEGGFVCFDCRAFLEDESGFLEALQGGDPEKERLILNMTGEPFEAMGPVAYTDYDAIPNWKWAPKEPLLELAEMSSLVALLDEQAQTCWQRAEEMADSSRVVEESHLWRALAELPDSEFEPVFQPELGLFWDAVPLANDLRWVLNVARWYAGLFPYRESGHISPLDLLLALSWSLPSKLREQAMNRAMVCEIACKKAQLRVFDRLLQERPQDLFLRYMVTRRNEGASRAVVLERVLWFLSEHPEMDCGACACEPQFNRRVLEAWCEAVRKEPSRIGVLTGMAGSVSYEQPHLALELWQRVYALAPSDSEQFFRAVLTCQTSAERGKLAEKAKEDREQALIWMERLIESVSDGCHRRELLGEALDIALEARNWPRLESLAQRLIESADEEDWDYDWYVHSARTALGEAALGRDELVAAKDYFLDSVGRVWYPLLEDYTPNFNLAQGFLDLGETEVVLQYFALCRKFWHCGTTLLDQWTEQLNGGEQLAFPTREEIQDLTREFINYDELEDWDA